MRYETISLCPERPTVTLTSYICDSPKDQKIPPRSAVIVCPGGGYNMLSFREAEPIVRRYFAAGFISTTFTALYAETLARVRRAPAIVFLLPGVIPTVPGGDLYRGMRDLISGKVPEALTNFGIALNIALGIAGGIVAVSIVYGIVSDAIKARKAKKKH